jgi:hypothetical protein
LLGGEVEVGFEVLARMRIMGVGMHGKRLWSEHKLSLIDMAAFAVAILVN